jgi:hypothetical protein
MSTKLLSFNFGDLFFSSLMKSIMFFIDYNVILFWAKKSETIPDISMFGLERWEICALFGLERH